MKIIYNIALSEESESMSNLNQKSIDLSKQTVGVRRVVTKEERKEAFKYYKQAFRPAAKYFFLDIFFVIIDVVFELSIPFVSRNALDLIENGITTSEQMNIVYLNVLYMFLLAMAGLGSGIMMMRCATKASTVFVNELRNLLFKQIQQFSFKNLDHFEVASLVTRITVDCNNLRMCIFMGGRMGLKSPFLVIFGTLFMFLINPILAAIVMGVSLIIVAVIFFIIYKSSSLYALTQVKLDNLNREIEEDCNGIKEIKAFVREKYVSDKFNETNTSYKETSVKVFSLINVNMPIVVLGLNLVSAIIIYYGGMNLTEPGAVLFGLHMKSSDISAFSSYSVTFLMSFNFMSVLVNQIVRARASKHRLDEVFSEKIDIPYEEKQKVGDFDPNVVEEGSIQFENCGLSYSNDLDKLAVGPVNISIKQGEIVGIIGGTGSGKTSLISLIPRLYDTTIGSCKIDGHDVKDYSLQALRSYIGVVTQKNVLFSGTIKDNVKWGKPDATDEEVDEALKLAQAYDFVYGFNNNVNTIVSQGGKSVSGGQKQRLTIARALIKKPKILILDDATSAVDTITESKIKQCFYKELKDTTVLLIAQRISSVQDADKIIVLDDGQVVGLGKHEELLQNCEVYRDIYNLQKSGVSE